jgi:cytochrome P450
MVCSDNAMDDNFVRDGKRVVKRYLPFSEGPRSCAGMSLAKANLTATLASLLGNFTFRVADEVSLKPSSLAV